MKRIAVVGAGFSGAVIARGLADRGDFRVEVFEQRDHVAGNCHTERDPGTGILVHRYGPHIFHTNRKDVWDYVNRFGEFHPFTNRVKAVVPQGVFSLPINLHTINQFFGLKLTPSEAKVFLESRAVKFSHEPRNFEEQGLALIGPELYMAFFEGYTRKQWGVDPKSLPASLLKRLPVRFTYNDSYYDSIYQGIPKDGYTAIVERILQHSAIQLYLGQRFDSDGARDFDHVFYSGPIDAFFEYSEGRLGYRSLRWEREEVDGDYQGNPVINYCHPDVPFTRISEHKHFAPWETHSRSLIFREFSFETEVKDDPYYPKRLEGDAQRFLAYQKRAESLPNLTFMGRLGTYRYLDMHQVIGEALDMLKNLTDRDGFICPRFLGSI